jgi:hypothetical protein
LDIVSTATIREPLGCSSLPRACRLPVPTSLKPERLNPSFYATPESPCRSMLTEQLHVCFATSDFPLPLPMEFL